MGRVTFNGPVKSLNGFEVGAVSSSDSSLAGTVVIDASGNGSFASVTLAPQTSNTIKIGTATTGWNNVPTTITLVQGASVTMNCNANSIFYIAGNTTVGGFTLTPVGGYAGQVVTIVWNVQTAASIAFSSSSSLAVRLMSWSPNGTLNSLASVTAWAGQAASVASITFINIGAGTATPTTQSVLQQIAPVYGASSIY